MALTETDKVEIAEAVAIGIKTAMSNGCLCGHGNNVVYLMDRLEAMGSGNIKKGIESFSKTFSMMTRIRHAGEKVGGAVAVFIVVSLVSGLGTLIYMGARAIIGGWKGP